jgi:two-component system, chemotaxis family, protein-glutamate methylesterase/glutaminase
MDGFTFLRILMSKQPTPVIVVSSYSQKENVFKALELGAIDFVAKPDRQFAPDGAIKKEILQKVLLVRFLRPPVPPPRSPSGRLSIPDTGRTSMPEGLIARPGPALKHVVAIASSTGGPTALVELFSRIPERFPGTILIAQHMPDKFTRTFAERLDRKGAIRVSEAQDGDLVAPRRAFVCPGKMCMELVATPTGVPGAPPELKLRVSPPLPTDRYVPSADRLLRSVAQVAGTRAVGVILTGMGDDGVTGGRAIKAAGGTVIAESEETAVVYGMPRAAVSAGIVNESLSLSGIGEFLALLA